MSNATNETLLTTSQVASLLKISRSCLFKRIRSKENIPDSFKIGRKRYFKTAEFLSWLDKKSHANKGLESENVE